MSTKIIPWSKGITNIQGNVLEALSTFKFLSLSQMLGVGVGTTQYKYLWKQVVSMRDRKRKLIDRRSFNLEARLGRVEDLYFLTKHGKNVLVYDFRIPEEDIKIPIGKTIAYKDYHHRKTTIDFQIKLYQWATERDYQISYFNAYFDKKGNNRSSKNLTTLTRINFDGMDYFIPDAVFKLASQSKERLFLFELHRGHDTARLLKQIHKHAFALVRKFTHHQFNYDPQKSYSILLVFEHQSTKNAFLKRLSKESRAFSQIEQFFLCKSLYDLMQTEFDKGWLTLFGRDIEMKL